MVEDWVANMNKNDKLDTKNTYYAMHWHKVANGKRYLAQQIRYRMSKDAIFRVDDTENYKRHLSKEVYTPYIECENLNLVKALTQLEPREERVIRMRYGIGFDKTFTLDEVGLTLNVSRERIRQIEAKALRKLKKIFKIYE